MFGRKCFLIVCQKATHLLGFVCLYVIHCLQQYCLKSSLQKLLFLLGRWILSQAHYLGAFKQPWIEDISNNWFAINLVLTAVLQRSNKVLLAKVCVTTNLGTWHSCLFFEVFQILTHENSLTPSCPLHHPPRKTTHAFFVWLLVIMKQNLKDCCTTMETADWQGAALLISAVIINPLNEMEGNPTVWWPVVAPAEGLPFLRLSGWGNTGLFSGM